MSSRAPFRDNSNDAVMLFAGLLGMLALLFAVIWFIFHAQISWFVIQCTWFAVLILDMLHGAATSIGVPEAVIAILVPQEVVDDIPSLKYWLTRIDPKQVGFKQFVRMLEVGGYCLRLLLLFLSTACIVHIWRRSRAARLSRVMNIFTLAHYSMRQFPQIRPAIIENLIKQDPDAGYYRREDSPIRFAIKNHLLKAYKVDFAGALQNEIVIPTFDASKAKTKGYEYIKDHYSKGISKLHNRCILDIEATEQAFIAQLGPMWTSSNRLPPFIRALYAALCAFACADKDTCFKLLDQFNRSWQPPTKKNTAHMDTTGVDDVIKRYEATDRIQEILNSHAFVTTVMSRLLEAARQKGRLGTSLFIWLKIVDRGLWYVLNQEGGQCAWTEAAGPRAHKLAEKAAKGPLFKPYVETSVTEFEEYLRNKEGWIPLPANQPKQGVQL